MADGGYYTLPVILSFKGIDEAVNKELGDKLKPAAQKAGEDYGKDMAEGVRKSAPEVTKATTEVVEKSTGGLKKAAQDAAGEFGTGILDGIRQGLDEKAGELAVGGFADGFKGGLDELKGSIRGWVSGIGADLKAGDIEGAVGTITGSIQNATNI